jgi:hypothetical protein
VPRPPHFAVTYTGEGLESAIFKSKFEQWDDVIAVDHRSPDLRSIGDSIRNRDRAIDFNRDDDGSSTSDSNSTASRSARSTCPFVVDASDLFAPPRLVIAEDASAALEEQWRADLDKMDTYVLQGTKFVRLAEEEVRAHAHMRALRGGEGGGGGLFFCFFFSYMSFIFSRVVFCPFILLCASFPSPLTRGCTMPHTGWHVSL